MGQSDISELQIALSIVIFVKKRQQNNSGNWQEATGWIFKKRGETNSGPTKVNPAKGQNEIRTPNIYMQDPTSYTLVLTTSALNCFISTKNVRGGQRTDFQSTFPT